MLACLPARVNEQHERAPEKPTHSVAVEAQRPPEECKRDPARLSAQPDERRRARTGSRSSLMRGRSCHRRGHPTRFLILRATDLAPAAQACCGVCGTCVTTNVVGIAAAAF